MGKRLPDEVEYEFAATNGGQTHFPWGDNAELIREWSLGKVGEPQYDRTRTNPPVFGLFSNVGEWTTSANVPYPVVEAKYLAEANTAQDRGIFGGNRIVRGAPVQVFKALPDLRVPAVRQANWNPRFRPAFSR